MKLKAVSLFCGCGGMDLGLLGGFDFLENFYNNLPFQVVYATDNDIYATALYNDNFEHKCVSKDVKEITSNEIPNHDILLGGFPCQSFSISAQNPPRLGYKDERGKLFFEIVRILKDKKPRFFVAENVKGLLSANKGQAFPIILEKFKNAGYHVKYKLLNASHYGVPQKRERVFMIGFKNILDYDKFEFPNPVTLDESVVKLELVISKEANFDEKWYFSERAIAGMLKVRHKMNKGREQNLQEPCNTISSHLAKVSLNSTDPVLKINERYRRFTPLEAARIQSFPNIFKFDSVSETRRYRAIGNAVPPVLMWHIAKQLATLVNHK